MRSPSAFVGVHWIELHHSRTATRLAYLYYSLIFLSVWIWQAPLVWQSAISLLVLCFLIYKRKRWRTLNAIALSFDKGVIACRRGGQTYQVRAFKVDYLLCYYIQIGLFLSPMHYQRLYIFPDSVSRKEFRYIRCMGIHYKHVRGNDR